MHFWKSNICTDQLDCKKQTSVSHSSIESEIISLDAGLRLDCSPALDLWDLAIEVLGMTQRTSKPTQACTRETIVKTQITPKIEQVLDQNVDLSNIDEVLSNAYLSEKESQLYIFEDNEAVIKKIIRGRSPTMRRVSRTRRFALHWPFFKNPLLLLCCVFLAHCCVLECW